MKASDPMGAPAGLLESARAVAGAVLALGCARLQLASTEVEEERLRLAELLLWATVALFFLGLGLVFAALLLVVLAWNGPREIVLAALAAGFLGVSAWSAVTWRRKARAKPPFLVATLAEFRHDAAVIDRVRR